MAIKTTSIRDVLKQKIKDSIEGPTIWTDINGVEYTDFQCTYLETSVSANGGYFISDCMYGTDGDTLVIDGLVIQVGSHVKKFTGGLASRPSIPVPDDFNPSNIFKFAKNLTHLYGTFYGPIIDLLGFCNNVTEDLFWGCQNLERCSTVFGKSSITKIPENLFAKCPNLRCIDHIFYDSSIMTIPENLFATNTKIESAKGAFMGCTNLTKQPKDLFKNCTKTVDQTNIFKFAGNQK